MANILAINPRRKRKKATTRGRPRTALGRFYKKRKPTTKRKPRRVAKKRTIPKRNVKRTTAKRGVKTMAKKRRKKSATAIVRRRRPTPRRNPTRTRRYARRAKETILGTEFGGVLRDIVPVLSGMMAGAYVSKRWGDEGKGGLSGDWGWKEYVLCILGGWGAGILASFIIPRRKAKLRQHGLLGGALLAAYFAVAQEAGGKSSTIQNWFGQGGQGDMGWAGATPGEVYTLPSGQTYVLGDDYEWYPMLGQNASIEEFVDEDLGEDPDELALLGDIVPESLGQIVPESLGQIVPESLGGQVTEEEAIEAMMLGQSQGGLSEDDPEFWARGWQGGGYGMDGY